MASEAARKKKQYTVVDRVDYITTVGHVTPAGTRRELHLRGGGPDCLITDLGVFDFAGPDPEMRLTSVHPGVSLDVVRACTGFELSAADDFRTTAPPTREEVGIIRKLDPLNVRKRLFAAGELDNKFDFD
jgi:glutaconate CoA-transferase subunit B